MKKKAGVARLVAGVALVLFVFMAGVHLGRNGKLRQEQTSGRILFERHCASCHGLAGEGDGPAAGSLKMAPRDLTQLKILWDKKYSLEEIARAIDGRRTIRVHGTSGMPVWGRKFEEYLEECPHTRRTACYHVQALAEYIHSLQR